MSTVYDVMQIEAEIEKLMDANEEIPQEKWDDYMALQLKTDEMVERLVKYIKHLEYSADAMKAEMLRIGYRKTKAGERIESIKNYLAPYVKTRGKFDVGTFCLSTRKSEAVQLDPIFLERIEGNEYMTKITEFIPDKKKIKEDLKQGVVIDGASLVERDNLQIK